VGFPEITLMDGRRELVEAVQGGAETVAAASRRLGVTRATAYKWLRRYEQEGEDGLRNRSRRPRNSPGRTPAAIEEQVCGLRLLHPAWGGRKLHHRLKTLGLATVPSPSAITDILKRYDLLSPDRRLKRDSQRFVAERPNQMWQMDFKGDFSLAQGRCYPLTVIDDHSRFNLCLKACTNQRGETVRSHLLPVFAEYGLPDTILVDNGPPWASGYSRQPHSRQSAWLIRLGIYVSHGRPFHPQTRGKDERFHRSLNEEVIAGRTWQNELEVQSAFDPWRLVYNEERPHEALAYRVPAHLYQPSSRSLPSRLPDFEYSATDEVRKVQGKGEISFRGRLFRVGQAFAGDPVALRATEDGVWQVFYCGQRVGTLDLRSNSQDAGDL
jgi:transposase InsO family protein